MFHRFFPFQANLLSRGLWFPTLVGVTAVAMSACHVNKDAASPPAPATEAASAPTAPTTDPTIPAPVTAPEAAGLPPFVACPDGAVLKDDPQVSFGRAEFCEKDGKKDGRFTRYWPTGAKAEEAEFIDGLQEGPYFTWDQNGQLTETGPFKDGKREGYFRSYQDGKLAFEGDFSADVQNGRFAAWHGTGAKQGEGTFRHGEPCGVFHCWEDDGSPAQCHPLDGKCLLTMTGAECPACKD